MTFQGFSYRLFKFQTISLTFGLLKSTLLSSHCKYCIVNRSFFSFRVVSSYRHPGVWVCQSYKGPAPRAGVALNGPEQPRPPPAALCPCTQEPQRGSAPAGPASPAVWGTCGQPCPGACTTAPLQSSTLAAPDGAPCGGRLQACFTTLFGTVGGPCS